MGNKFQESDKEVNMPNKDIPTRIEVENMILHAKVDIARWKITILLALLALLGVVLPLVGSFRQDVRVEKAIADIDNRFNELAGKQLRKPKIVCRFGDKLLSNNVIDMNDKSKDYRIGIYNDGDGVAGPIDIYVYLNELSSSAMTAFPIYTVNEPSDEPDYKYKYSINHHDHIAPQDVLYLGLSRRVADKSEKPEYKVMLKIFYGEPSPAKFPFAIQLGKR